MQEYGHPRRESHYSEQRHENYRDNRDDEREEEYEQTVRKKRVKPMELTLAHFNPQELEVLDREQGGRTFIPGTKTPHYKKIEIMISSPGGADAFKRAFEKHAAGGMIGESKRHIDELKRKGRFGDTAVAYLGPNTVRIMSQAVKDLTGDQRENKNPHTGLPEFYGLANFFGGLRNGFTSMGKYLGNATNEVMGHLRNAAPGIIQGGIQGLMTGGPEGALAGAGMGAMNGMMSSAMNPNSKGNISQMVQNPYFNQLMGAGASAYDRMNQGQNWQDNLASTISQGTQGVNNPYAQSLNQGANAYQATDGNMGRALAAGAGNFLANGGGESASPFRRVAGTALQSYGNSGDPMRALYSGANGLMR